MLAIPMVIRGKSATELAYIAGLFDGEGYITISIDGPHKTQRNAVHLLVVGVGMTDRPTIERFKEIWGGMATMDPREYPNRKRVYIWRVTGPQAILFINDVYKYLRIKKPQADIARRFQVLKSHRWGRGGIPAENMTERNDLCERIRAMNTSRFNRPQRLSERAP